MDLNWKHIFKNPFIYTKDSKLQWLQYRINNRILGINNISQKWVQLMIIDVPFVNMKMKLLCTYLGNVYMFKPSWRNLKQCVENSQIMNQIECSKADFIFGSQYIKSCINVTFRIAKSFHVK